MKFLLPAVIAAVVTTCGACTLHLGIERSALDYNRSADRVDKEVLLLNIARAKRGEGLTFTGITELRGSFSIKADGSLEVPFGGTSDANVSGSGVAYQTNPSIKVVPLATKKFQQGISNDIDPSILFLLWERGWPKEVLLHLFIEKIVVTTRLDAPRDAECLFEGGGRWTQHPDTRAGYVCEFVNDPDHAAHFRAFQRFLREARVQPYLHVGSGKRIGPRVRREELALLKVVADAHDGALKVRTTEQGDRYFLESRPERGLRFSLDKRLSQTLADRLRLRDTAVYASVQAARDESNAGMKAVEVVVHLRAAEGLIYYLGEVLRAEVGRDNLTRNRLVYQKIYDTRPGDRCRTEDRHLVAGGDSLSGDPCLVPLFVAWMGQGDAEVSVQTPDGRIYVPSGNDGEGYLAGQSLLVMAMIRSLFNLNTSLDDLPATETVITTGIGQ